MSVAIVENSVGTSQKLNIELPPDAPDTFEMVTLERCLLPCSL